MNYSVNFDRDDGTHRWEPLRSPGAWPDRPWDPTQQFVISMFAEAAQKKVQSNWRGIPPNEHSKEWQRSINRATGMRGMNWYVTDPSKAALRKNLDFPEGYAYVCRKCKETTFIKYGSFIQCKSCAHRRAKRWYQRNAESKRQIELARYHHNKTRKLADDHPSTPDS